MKFLLDTCTVSYIINNSYSKVRENLMQFSCYDLAISSITQAELVHGLNKNPSKKREQVLNSLYELIQVLPFDSNCAFTYGKIRANNEKKGICLGAMDGLIAAHAITEKRKLVTKDKAFSLIKELDVTDWTI